MAVPEIRHSANSRISGFLMRFIIFLSLTVWYKNALFYG
jgi:hypothetical protein